MATSIATDIWLGFTTWVSASLPSQLALACAGPLFLMWSTFALTCAARVKRATGGRTGYSRKLFHLLIFGAAAAAQLTGGLGLVCVLGATTTVVLAYAIVRGDGHPFYEALAREADAPHRTYYIVSSYLATLAGGVAGNLLAGRLALLGYLVCGLGDAAGEPVGTRWGRHWYAVPGAHGRGSQRSVEGSAGVFAASAAALFAGVAVLSNIGCALHLAPQLLATAWICTLLEAWSPHGWDNATMQIAPSLIATLWFAEHIN